MSKRRTPRPARRPFVFVNMAMTADGKIATANRAVSTFGSRRDFEHLLELRATADAVMCGARTVEADDVNLGPGPLKYRRLRLRRGLAEYNLRIVVSGTGSIDPASAIFKRRFSPIVVLVGGKASKRRIERLRGVADEVKVCGADGIDFAGAFQWLRRRWNVRRLLCEGGGALNFALFEAGLVDELHLTVCPLVLGGRAAPSIADGEPGLALPDAARLRLKSRKRVGSEMFLVFDAT